MIITLAVRVLMIIFAVIVLALSVVLINRFGPGHAPSIYDYGAFCGGASIVIALVGVVACFFDALQGLVMLILDGLATLFLLAGGIAFAAILNVGSCTDTSPYGYLDNHAKTFAPSFGKSYGYDIDSDNGKYAAAFIKDTENRCRMAQADTAFVWFTFACAAGCIALSFLGGRGNGQRSLV